jgi:hypothetical protein
MKQIEPYPDAHVTNPYYARSRVNTLDFANAIATAYMKLNARRTADCFIGSVADRIAKEADAAYEKQLVRLSPPAIPSQGPPLPPHEVPSSGGIQYKMPLRDTD